MAQKKKRFPFPYRRANHLLLGLILLVNGYVIAAPFWPQLTFWYQARTDRGQTLSRAVERAARPDAGRPAGPDSLIIPAMLFEGAINQGTDTYAELNKGVWLWPQGSRPDKGGNTVMLAHRFTYANPRGPFYFLDKVKLGDKIGVTWRNQSYVYRVNDTRTVSAREVSILDPTTEPTLTLYTCTPLWNPTERLVVKATLEAKS